MEKGINDLVVDQLHALKKLVAEKIQNEYRSTKPFRGRPMTDKDMVDMWDEMKVDEMKEMRGQMGETAYNQYGVDMEERRRKTYGR